MRPTLRTAVSAAALLAAGAAIPALLAGPLNPPAGPPASTYKTLTEVEPRTAVNSTNTPGNATRLYRITAPGSYYLTGNIATAPGGPAVAIEIAAPGVRLDLCGFDINTAANPVGSAIVVSAPDALIKSGNIHGSTGTNAAAIDDASTLATTVEDVTIQDVYSGIKLGPSATIRRCHVRNATSGAAFAATTNALIEDCRAAACPTGIVVQDHAVVRRCTLDGVTTGIALSGPGAEVTANRLRGGTSGAPTGIGIQVANAGGGLIAGNTIEFFAFGVAATASSAQVIVRNDFCGDTTNIAAAPASLIGPLVTSASIGTNTNPDANYDN